MNEMIQCRRCGSSYSGSPSQQPTCPKCLMELGLSVSSIWMTGSGEPAAPPPDPEELGRVLPEYEILELIGQGGMGVVYRARQRKLDRLVALKVLPPSTVQDESFPQRFAREARALAGLNHPGITAVYDFGEAEGYFWFAMELVDGVNLRRLLRESQVSAAQALELVSQICEALQYAHQRGVVHRDIKPENVLVDREGRVKISDFGLAKILGREGRGNALTRSFQVMGTPHYMAPEQVERPMEVDHRADIYSLGVVFYELLTGELPLGRFTPPSGKVEVDVRLDEVVLRTLAKEPQLRYQTAGDVRTDVDNITHSRAPRHVRHAGAVEGGKRSRFKLALAALLLLVLGVVALGTLLTFARARAARAVAEQEAARVAAEMAREHQAVRAEAVAWAGGDLVAFVDGQPDLNPELSQALAQNLRLQPGALKAVQEAMLSVYRSYLELEEKNAELSVSDDARVRVDIEPFEADRAALQAYLGEQIDRALGSPGLLDTQRIADELMPFGAERGWIEIWSAPEGIYSVQDRGAARAELARSRPDFPREAQRFWSRTYLLPASGLHAARLVLGAIEEVEDEVEGEIFRVRDLSAEASGRSVGPPAVAEAEFAIEVHAADVVEASRLYGELRQALQAKPWCISLEDTGTTELADGGGLVGERLRIGVVDLRPGRRVLPEDLPGVETLDVETYIRTVAAEPRFGVRGLRISPNQRPVGFGPGEQRLFRVRPDDEEGFLEFDVVLDFIEALEAGARNYTASEIRLNPKPNIPGKPDPRWSYSLEFGVAVRR